MDCGGGSCLSGSSYGSRDIKYGRNGSGDRGGGGRGDQGSGSSGSTGDCFSFCLCVRTITVIAASSVPKIEPVLSTSEETNENRAYEEKYEDFDKENLSEASERFMYDLCDATGERARRRGRIRRALVSIPLPAVVQERGGLWMGG